MNLLSRQEELVLVTVWKLGKTAYGNAIRRELEESTGNKWLIGSVYAPISKMLKTGLIVSENSEPTKEKGGRSKVVYHLTRDGREALINVKNANDELWMDVPSLS